MSQKITGKETKTDDEFLKIEKVQFRYTKEELKSERSWGSKIGNNLSFDKKIYKGIKEIKDPKHYRNEDYYIDELEDLLKNPTAENNLKIQNSLSPNVLTAIYIPNQEFKKENPHRIFFSSRIDHLLKKYGWKKDSEKEQEQEILEKRKEAAEILGFTMKEVELFTKYKEIKELESKTRK